MVKGTDSIKLAIYVLSQETGKKLLVVSKLYADDGSYTD